MYVYIYVYLILLKNHEHATYQIPTSPCLKKIGSSTPWMPNVAALFLRARLSGQLETSPAKNVHKNVDTLTLRCFLEDVPPSLGE